MHYKFAVIIATYQRKNNNTLQCITNVAQFLNNQTYKNFKIFLIGDKYDNNDEFLKFKNLFNNDIYIHNNNKCFRNNVFNIQQNKWTCGGMLARYHGIKQACKENIQYYLHLDDDDIWSINHIEKINKVICDFPDIDFLMTKANYGNMILPREKINKIEYNNYKIKPRDSVHSSWCINLKTLISLLNLLFNWRIDRINRFINKTEKEVELLPFDAVILTHLQNKQNDEKIKCICSTHKTVTKKNDCNIPN